MPTSLTCLLNVLVEYQSAPHHIAPNAVCARACNASLQCSCAVVASEKGVVVGRLTFREDGDLIDCQRMGVGGKAIPPNVDKVHACCFTITTFLVRGGGGLGACITWDFAMQCL